MAYGSPVPAATDSRPYTVPIGRDWPGALFDTYSPTDWTSKNHLDCQSPYQINVAENPKSFDFVQVSMDNNHFVTISPSFDID